MTEDRGQRLVDHHCHGLVTDELARDGFESLMNEADGPSPLGTTLFDSMLGAAVRRWCAPVLDLEPFPDPDTYLERRRALGADEVNARFLRASGVTDFVVDTGFEPGRLTTPRQTAAYADGDGHEIVRLEYVAEKVLADGTRDSDFAREVRRRLTDAGAVGAKSIAAYRIGLDLPPRQPTTNELSHALGSLVPGSDGRFRIAHPVVNAWLAYEAIDAGLPLQIHTGYGDSDVDLARCDPLLLTGFLRATRDRGVPVMLLHNYPFHRNASYLAQVFPQAFVDVGLATHNTGALSQSVVRETLELVPFSKLLYSSDAFGLAEFYFLGSLLFRRGLDRELSHLVSEGELAQADAERARSLVEHENARRVYGLP
ncbi:MAG: amidohydrolase family protein [Actinomycetia bacterium]|nr:amidohydrolase family protein [Actinomycetes bacterium]